MALANGIGLLQAGYPENEPGSVPHLPPIRRPVVPDMANVTTAKGVLNSNFRCGSVASYGDRLAEEVVRKQTLSQARMSSSKPRRSNPYLRPVVMTRYPSKRSAPRKGAVSQWETVPPGKGRSSR
jgi:hypothetical protein